jgi:hypothetical protein
MFAQPETPANKTIKVPAKRKERIEAICFINTNLGGIDSASTD